MALDSAAHIDLELFIRPEPGASETDNGTPYFVDLRWFDPAQLIEPDTIIGRCMLPKDAVFTALQGNAKEYGAALSDALFSDPALLAEYRRAWTLLDADPKNPRKLRLRLKIERSLHHLHTLRWETLLGPPQPDGSQGTSLAVDPRVLFSRYLSPHEALSIRLRKKDQLRALVVIANPSNLTAQDKDDEDDDPRAQNPLKSIKVADELERTRAALAGVITRELVSDPQVPGTVTIDTLREALAGGYDVLYMICHGVIAPVNGIKEHCLVLENEQGTSELVPSRLLVERLRDPALRPLVVVLSVCQSAGSGVKAKSRDDSGVLLNLGAQLVQQAGVGAALAMQGTVLMSTVERFMPRFFKELSEHGRVEAATCEARRIIDRATDVWMPVLYSCLRAGSIWYQPGFQGKDPNDKTADETALTAIQNSGPRCVPIVGPDFAEAALGSAMDLAKVIAKKTRLSPIIGTNTELHHVAQAVISRLKRPELYQAYVESQLDLLLARCRLSVAPELQQQHDSWAIIGDPAKHRIERIATLLKLCNYAIPADAGLPPLNPAQWDHPIDDPFDPQPVVTVNPYFTLLAHLTLAVGMNLHEHDPHRILARRRLPFYITTRPDNLLLGALIREQQPDMVQPVSEIFRWRLGVTTWPPSVYDPERAQAKYKPSPAQPLIYHLFGRLDCPESLVLSEDDYLDHLLAMHVPVHLDPSHPKPSDLLMRVKMAMKIGALLFLGFKIDDWPCRVMLRGLLHEEEVRKGRREQRQGIPKSVAVQVAPDERYAQPEGARIFLKEFFDDAVIDIYWGEVGDFVDALEAHARIQQPGGR